MQQCKDRRIGNPINLLEFFLTSQITSDIRHKISKLKKRILKFIVGSYFSVFYVLMCIKNQLTIILIKFFFVFFLWDPFIFDENFLLFSWLLVLKWNFVQFLEIGSSEPQLYQIFKKNCRCQAKIYSSTQTSKRDIIIFNGWFYHLNIKRYKNRNISLIVA